MNREAAQKIADAILYEGYLLYPYRPSAVKNRQRWCFGTLYPPAYEEVRRGTESNRMHSECLLVGDERTTLRIELRFLQLRTRQVRNAGGEPVAFLLIDEQRLESWEEGVARSFEFEVANAARCSVAMPFSFAEEITTEVLQDRRGRVAGSVVRCQYEIKGMVSCLAEFVADGMIKLTIEVINQSTDKLADARDQALLRSMLSAHLILSVEVGEFLSLLEPPVRASTLANGCRNVGNFPVLVGEPGSHDMLLCSPILLYDYPQVAPESAGDFFDGTEMDEMLTLRVMTLTEDEKNAMRSADERVRELLQRTEDTAREQLTRTHGTIRDMRPSGEER